MHKSTGVFVVVAVVLGCCCFVCLLFWGVGMRLRLGKQKGSNVVIGSDSFAVELTRRVFFLFQYHTTTPHGM